MKKNFKDLALYFESSDYCGEDTELTVGDVAAYEEYLYEKSDRSSDAEPGKTDLLLKSLKDLGLNTDFRAGFEDVMAQILGAGLKHFDAVAEGAKELYSRLMYTLHLYVVHFCLKSRNQYVKDADGKMKVVFGNKFRLEALRDFFGEDIDAVTDRVLEHVLRNFDNMLARSTSPGHAANYVYRSVNCALVSEYRKLKSGGCADSLDRAVDNDGELFLGDTLSRPCDAADTSAMTKEILRERRELMTNAMGALRNPVYQFALLMSFLNKKPGETAKDLMRALDFCGDRERAVKLTYVRYITDIAKSYNELVESYADNASELLLTHRDFTARIHKLCPPDKLCPGEWDAEVMADKLSKALNHAHTALVQTGGFERDRNRRLHLSA